MLFLQHVIDSLAPEGRCGIVLDEGVLFRTNELAFVQTKRRLLEECDLYCIVSLPGGAFSGVGAGVKTNLLFFRKGKPTEKIWFYDLSDIKVGKRTPFTIERFDDFFRLLPDRSTTERSWMMDFARLKSEASEAARPIRAKADRHKSEANRLKSERKEQKKNGIGGVAIAKLDAAIAAEESAAREASRQAEEMETVVYDLKAVNPNRPSSDHASTSKELVAVIAVQEKVISKALDKLYLA